jgi:hypothetical protein
MLQWLMQHGPLAWLGRRRVGEPPPTTGSAASNPIWQQDTAYLAGRWAPSAAPGGSTPLTDREATLATQLRALYEALARYGRHLPTCGYLPASRTRDWGEPG